jgi:hypothetical protein
MPKCFVPSVPRPWTFNSAKFPRSAHSTQVYQIQSRQFHPHTIMTAPTPLRRSTRPRIPTQKALYSTLACPRIKKRRSARLAQLTISTSRKHIAQKFTYTRLGPSPILSDFLVHDITPPLSSSSSSFPSSSSTSSFCTSTPSSPSSSEQNFLSTTNIAYLTSDDLSRRESYDSRFGLDNEDYELDGFVVGDSSDDRVSEVGSEITIVSRLDYDGERMCDDESEVSGGARKGSVTSTGTVLSEGWGLFVTDEDEPHTPLLTPVSPIPIFRPIASHVDPADIAEEIIDAVVRFSRRCNRHCEALRLEITQEVWEDGDIRDPVGCAVKRRMGRVEEGREGVWLFSVGPAERSTMKD